MLMNHENRESKVYGINACLALFAERPEAIMRAYFTRETLPRFKEVMRSLAALKRPYREVPPEELQRVAGAGHHEGVCFTVIHPVPLRIDQFLKDLPEGPHCLVALEEIGNAQNLGAIMRVCAHYGVPGIVMSEAKRLQSGAALRTAEGAYEHVQPLDCDDLLTALDALKEKGYRVVTTSSHWGKPLSKTRFPDRCVMVFGSESLGLTKQVMEAGELKVQIDGSGQVESLNVATATAVILNEFWRVYR
ncbi:MAG: TrmH RNA methyltransferase [Kiritimatiellia bacterium]|jgi:RNA methyltransferase, TrmH family